jgi:hypothetical protein
MFSLAVFGIQPREAPLAGYLLARAALHRKIEGAVLENLRAGHESVQEVSDLLPLGRANVREDFQKAKSQRTLQRHLASLELRKTLVSGIRLPDGTVPAEEYYPLAAATSQYAKTGVCHSYATNTTALHGAKLAGMPDKRAIVAQTAHATIDHVWSEMLPLGKGRDGKPILHGEDVIMDGWCREGLAVLREDSRFAALDKDGQGDHLIHEDLLDHRSGPEALASVKRYKARIEESGSLQQEFHAELHNLVATRTEVNVADLWTAQPSCHADFRQEAGTALHQDAKHPDARGPAPGKGAGMRGGDPVARRAKQATLIEIQAVGVARSLGSNIRGALAEAPGILAAAREMFPRPDSEGEGFLSRLSAFFMG